jgi:diguanylate cyclase (GGDEF)-like protein
MPALPAPPEAAEPAVAHTLMAPVAAAQPAHDWDHSTMRLNKADISLLQTLGGDALRQPCLVLYSGDQTGTRFPLVDGRLVLGRSPDCDVCLESLGISRRHAELREERGTVVLHDLGSSNGTHLNDQRVTQAMPLKDGDLIRLGQVLLRFYERHSVDAVLHDKLYRLATMDTGTGVYSKRYLLETLEREIKVARRSARPLSVICLDLDFFKTVNDRYGHNAGDDVLRGAAQAAQSVLRGSDVLGRMGGEEFAVVLPDTTLLGALDMAERMRRAVAAQVFDLPLPGTSKLAQHRQTASLGVAELLPAMTGARDLLAAADARLYESKRGGRNCVSS